MTINVYADEKDYTWNTATSSGNCGSTMDDSSIKCDEVIESYSEETKTIPTDFNGKEPIRETENFYISTSCSSWKVPVK